MCANPCTFIIDTGADISIIKENSLNLTQNIFPKYKCIINGVTDGKINSIGITYTNILIDDLTIPAKFQVVDKNFPICTDGILGRDFLAEHGCNICLKSWLLTFSYKNHGIEIPIEDKFKNQLVIPPRCQVVKKILLPNLQEDSVITGAEISPGVFIGSSIVNKNEQYVNILNVNSKLSLVPFNLNNNIKVTPLSMYDKIEIPKKNIKEKRNQKLFEELKFDDIEDRDAKAQLKQLCINYSDVFALEGEKLTANNFYKQQIHLNSNGPVYIKNYRTPEAQKEEMNIQINKMVDDGIIQPSISPYNSPILLVPKKSNTNEKKWRLVVDFRQLNKKVIADKFPLPRIDEMLDNLGRAKYFTTLDLTSGFHQIELDEESKQYTAFSSTTGHYEFNRLPFGLNISPNSFQRMMTIALSGLPPECAFLYIDDILVVGCSIKQHLLNLETVFQRLRKYNLKLNPAKCNFFRHDVTYLGHHISEEGILPDPTKYKTVENYPIPSNADEVRRFVAFCNYYRRFIPNFAGIAYPLNRLLRKNINFKWTDECQNAFDTLKTKLISPPILKFPDYKKEFTLITDASKLACGAILTQTHNGIDLPIAYASKTFTRGESNKSTIEQELTAIHWAITYFRPYLYGRKFTVKTDHRPLVYLFSMKNPTSKLTRMRLELEEFNFDVQYVQGKTNVGADALSRVQIDSETLKNLTILKVQTRAMVKKNQIHPNETNKHVTSNDDETDHLKVFEALNINEVFNIPKLNIELEDNQIIFKILSKNYKRILTSVSTTLNNEDIFENMMKKVENSAEKLNIGKIALVQSSKIFQLINIQSFKEMGNKTLTNLKIVLYSPRKVIEDRDQIQEILKQNHDSAIGGHVGINRLYRKLKLFYSWNNMKQTITDFIKDCTKCKETKHKQRTKENFIHTPTPMKTFDSIAMDTIGPFQKSISGNRYALTIQCDLSKYVIVKPIQDKQANTIAKAFIESCILIYGTPSIIRTDQGTEYKNETFSRISELLKYSHSFSTPYHPQTIANLERNHRCINEYLRQFVNDSQSDWDEWLPYYSFCYNTTPHTGFPYSPFELVFGKSATLPNNLKNPDSIEPVYNFNTYYTELKHRLQTTAAKAKIIIDRIKSKRNSNQLSKANPIEIKLGDKVMLEIPNRNKLDNVYKGPFTVTRIDHPNVKIENKSSNATHIVHKNRIIKC